MVVDRLGEKIEEISQLEKKGKMNNRKDKKLQAIPAASPLQSNALPLSYTPQQLHLQITERLEKQKEIHKTVTQENIPDLKFMSNLTEINTK